jgi:hypothetical protein
MRSKEKKTFIVMLKYTKVEMQIINRWMTRALKMFYKPQCLMMIHRQSRQTFFLWRNKHILSYHFSSIYEGHIDPKEWNSYPIRTRAIPVNHVFSWSARDFVPPPSRRSYTEKASLHKGSTRIEKDMIHMSFQHLRDIVQDTLYLQQNVTQWTMDFSKPHAALHIHIVNHSTTFHIQYTSKQPRDHTGNTYTFNLASIILRYLLDEGHIVSVSLLPSIETKQLHVIMDDHTCIALPFMDIQ